MRILPLLIAIASAALALTACASPEELRAMDQNACAGYGFQPGTDSFAKCMMKQSDKREQDMRARMEEAQKQMHQPAAQPAAPAATTVIVIPTTTDSKAKLPDCRMQDPGVTLNSDGRWTGPNCTPAY
ncbi:hypothetical protein [Chromobacterium sphagni]|uniref:Lipoprotein n=1 Tax=Chromobacterium sphagni TaxID=1903179 RepID=A0A1S1X4A9_9NEIS|nr:hypothetical protein [Chromobacterium sphagni]OHX14337.1 hypothetical protein BI347_13095 [Chromobacterium sphagni]OHX16331.1 hypothetical protein BI344_13010 [Chromobacterium sphagni]